MSEDLSKINWGKINDFLLSLSAEQSVKGLDNKILAGLSKLIRFENSAVLVELKDNFKADIINSVNLDNKWKTLFNNYYYNLSTTPDIDDHILSANYGNLNSCLKIDKKDEYVNDFIYPQGISFSAGFLISNHENKPTHCMMLNRTKNEKMFNQEKIAVLKIIQPHISNFHKTTHLIDKLKKMLILKSEIEITNDLLSKREFEVVHLLLQRQKLAEIAKELKISVLTVRKHIENIYRKLNVMDRHELFQKVNISFNEGREE